MVKPLATGGDDRTVILWDVANRKPLGEPLKAHSSNVLSVAFSPDGKILATSSGERRAGLEWFMPDSLIGHYDGTVIFWDVANRKPLGEPLKAHSGSAWRSIAFSPDGKTLATGGDDGTVILWDVANRKPLGEPLKAHSGSVQSVAFSPDDGKTLATGTNDTVILWDIASLKPLGEPLKAGSLGVGQLGTVLNVAYSSRW
jgi:WD40 repeat protein